MHHSAAGKATRPEKEIAVGHIRQMAPYAVWKKKKKKKERKEKKSHARIMAQNSRESLDLKGTRQMGIMDIPVKINVDRSLRSRLLPSPPPAFCTLPNTMPG